MEISLDPNLVAFAQLLGMRDHVAFILGTRTFYFDDHNIIMSRERTETLPGKLVVTLRCLAKAFQSFAPRGSQLFSLSILM